jgi:hypothetical protein
MSVLGRVSSRARRRDPKLRNGQGAIFETFKAINNRVKNVTGLDLDGNKLMAEAFADSDPPIALADL